MDTPQILWQNASQFAHLGRCTWSNLWSKTCSRVRCRSWLGNLTPTKVLGHCSVEHPKNRRAGTVDTVDGRNHQLIGGLSWFIHVYPILFIGFQPSFWWCRISQPSTVVHLIYLLTSKVIFQLDTLWPLWSLSGLPWKISETNGPSISTTLGFVDNWGIYS